MPHVVDIELLAAARQDGSRAIARQQQRVDRAQRRRVVTPQADRPDLEAALLDLQARDAPDFDPRHAQPPIRDSRRSTAACSRGTQS
jgi:hypothetical protein